MSNVVLENVSKAICCSDGDCEAQYIEWGCCHSAYESEARSALAAVRVPTEAMINAALDKAGMGEVSATALAQAYTAMIDVALRP